MSDEDTTVLLDTEVKLKQEIQIDSTKSTYRDLAQNTTLTRRQLNLSAVIAVIAGFCFGYDLGIAANLILPINDSFNLNCKEQFYIASTWVLGSIFSALFGGHLIDICGRRWCIIMSALFLLCSSILTLLPSSLSILLTSRFISGFSGPISAISQCIYMSETADPKYRGFRITLHQLGMSLGGLMTCIAGYVIEPNSHMWRIIMGLNGFLAFIVLICTLIWLPQSSHFVIRQRVKTVKIKSKRFRYELFMEMFSVSSYLVQAQILCGRFAVLFYAPRLFSLLGICAEKSARMAISTFSLIKFLSVCVCLCIVDRLGRRTVLIMSSTIMMTCLALLGLLASIDDPESTIYHYYHENCRRIPTSDTAGFLTIRRTDLYQSDVSEGSLVSLERPPPFPMLPTPLSLTSSQSDMCPGGETTSSLNPTLRIVAIITVVLYEFAETLGFGTLNWVLLSEIFPARFRGRSMCGITLLEWMADFVEPTLFIELGPSVGSTFLIYSLICMVTILFTFFFIPETKDKTLEQISEEMRNLPLVNRMCYYLNGLPYFNKSEFLQRQGMVGRNEILPVPNII